MNQEGQRERFARGPFVPPGPTDDHFLFLNPVAVTAGSRE
jgi:hypothetical protein